MRLDDLQHALRRRVTLLGSTGSIGLSTLSVIEHARDAFGPEAFPIQALTAQSNVKALAEQAERFRPAQVVIGDASLRQELCDLLAGTGIAISSGEQAIVEAASAPTDVTMVGIVGAAGLAPALAAVNRGGLVALANKECVVAAGQVFKDAMRTARAVIVPVDSEHNAAFQVLDFAQHHAIEKVTLTASGGPFRKWPREQMVRATPREAVAHPNWSMGAKISVDSATLMNKGLELIEAHHLFGLPPEQLDVIVHPQSIVHCLVSYADGSLLAHLSAPDMRTPIAVAMAWPTRIASPSNRLDLTASGSLSFEAPDRQRFPCLALAEDCMRAGGASPTILNAANEVAVRAFLDGRIGFMDIAGVVESVLERTGPVPAGTDLGAVLAIDADARDTANSAILRLAA